MPTPPDSGLLHPASYSVAPNGVLDNVTSLTWEEPLGDTNTCVATYTEAMAYCGALGSGWRVPTRIELVSLLDYTQTNGAHIDPNYFQPPPTGYFWTSTPLGGSMVNWCINFQSGNISDTNQNPVCHVRCVQ